MGARSVFGYAIGRQFEKRGGSLVLAIVWLARFNVGFIGIDIGLCPEHTVRHDVAHARMKPGIQAATAEALTYLDHSLDAGFHPGMGNIVPDRMFWAQTDVDAEDSEIEPDEAGDADDEAIAPLFKLPTNGITKH